MEAVEAVFRPILIPHRSVVALAAMRDSVKSPQPMRLERLRSVAGLVQRSRITLIDAQPPATDPNGVAPEIEEQTVRLMVAALNNGWRLCTSLPLLTQAGTLVEAPLPAQQQEILRDVQCIVDSLRHLGELTTEEHQRASQGMGERHTAPLHQEIERGATILCRAYILESLAEANLLSLTAGTFHLAIDRDEFVHAVSAQIDALNTSEDDAAWLAKLLGHLSRGLESGAYCLMQDVAHKGDAISSAAEEDPVLRCFLDLLKFGPKPGDIIWADDRWLGGRVHLDGALLVDTVDMLYALADRGTISPAKCYEKLRVARESRFRFIPLYEDELLAAVAEAPIRNHELLETPSLRVLHKYYAQCLVEGALLAVNPAPEASGNSPLEWPFIVGSGQAVIGAIVRVWHANTQDLDAARVRSEWLLSNLYTPDRGRSLTLAKSAEPLDLQIEALALSGFLCRGTVFSATDQVERTARRAYFGWIYRRLIQSRFTADPQMAALTLDGLKRMIDIALGTVAEPVLDRQAGLAVARAFFADLPQELQQQIAIDATFMTRIGAPLRATMAVGPHVVFADELWNAAADAFRPGVSTRIRTRDGAELEVRHEIAERRRLLALDQTANSAYILLADGADVFSASAADREHALRTVRYCFDCSSSEFERAVATIAVIEEPSARMDELIRSWRRSAENYYGELGEAIRQGQEFRPADFIPPDTTSLWRHLRFPSDLNSPGDIATIVEQAAATLIDDVGVEAAATRLAGLPVTMPQVIIAALGDLPITERSQVISRVLRAVFVSPLGTAHSARILSAFSGDSPRYAKLARRLVNRNLRSGDYVQTWLAVLHRCSEDLCYVEEFRRTPPAARLVMVWSHADRLFRILRNLRVPIDWIQENICDTGYRMPAEIVFADSEYASDVAYPRKITVPVFGLASAAYVLAGTDSAGAEPLKQVVVHAIEQNRYFLAALMRDASRAPNFLKSFLAPVNSWCDLFPESASEAYAPDVMRAAFGDLLEQLKSGTDEAAVWGWITAVVGDWPPPPELVGAFRQAVLSTDFKALYEKTLEHRLFPIVVASAQAIHLGKDVVSYLRSQLIAIAVLIQGRQPIATADEADTKGILAAAFNIAAGMDSPSGKFADLALLTNELLGASPSLKQEVTSMVTNFINCLRTNDSRHFWPIQTKLRAL